METINEKIAIFLKELETEDSSKYEIVTKLREITFEQLPTTSENFKYGGIMLSLNSEFGGIFVYKKHISFEFSYGYQLKTSLKLEGGGKFRRHLKFKSFEDIDMDGLKELLVQVGEIDNS